MDSLIKKPLPFSSFIVSWPTTLSYLWSSSKRSHTACQTYSGQSSISHWVPRELTHAPCRQAPQFIPSVRSTFVHDARYPNYSGSINMSSINRHSAGSRVYFQKGMVHICIRFSQCTSHENTLFKKSKKFMLQPYNRQTFFRHIR